MSFTRLLKVAGVPEHLYEEAISCLDKADERSEGILLKKLKIRLFKAGKIAKMLRWEDNHLVLVHPEYSHWDVAPMTNMGCNGDNIPWGNTPEGGRPLEEYWLDPDPESEEYKAAVAACYWAPGNHPRSYKARKAWFRRNGGEYIAWVKGLPIDPTNLIQEWEGEVKGLRVSVVRCGDLWIINSWRKLGPIVLKGRHGFEIDNVIQKINGQRVQAWFPIPGFQLRAPVSWSTVPKLEWPL